MPTAAFKCRKDHNYLVFPWLCHSSLSPFDFLPHSQWLLEYIFVSGRTGLMCDQSPTLELVSIFKNVKIYLFSK